MVVPTLLSPFLYKSLLANTHGKLSCSTVNAGAGKLIISGRALALELLQDPPASCCRGVRASVGSLGLPAVGLSDSLELGRSLPGAVPIPVHAAASAQSPFPSEHTRADVGWWW